MPIHRRLALYTYNLDTGSATERSATADNLEIATTQPGGYSELACTIRVPNARIIPSDLNLFARIVVMDGPFCVFSGRLDEPALALTDQDGDVYQLHAMGGADCLKDDPQDIAYSGKTPQYVAIDQISAFHVAGGSGSVPRSGFIPLDQDTALIFPDNPSGTYSPDPNSKNIEDVLNELIPLVGDYSWGVWGHPTHTDALGFPTWQLFVHQRDTTTVSYIGYLAGEGGSGSDAYSIRPAVEYSYNVVQLKYRDTSSDLPSSVTVRDARLNNDNTQGSAPIPYRKIVKDFSSIHLSSSEAQTVANAILAQYENGGWKNEVTLARVYDANGNEIPLWQVRADANIFLPELSPIGTTLPTVVTQGTNLFYITQTRYSEASGQIPMLTVTLDSFWDSAAFQIARMQYIHISKAANNKVKHTVREAGNPETGNCALAWGSTALAGDTYGCTVNFKTSMTAAPTSITFSGTSSSNASARTASAITNVGFEYDATVQFNGAGYSRAKYTTVGN
jgi:hypothetical protein